MTTVQGLLGGTSFSTYFQHVTTVMAFEDMAITASTGASSDSTDADDLLNDFDTRLAAISSILTDIEAQVSLALAAKNSALAYSATQEQ